MKNNYKEIADILEISETEAEKFCFSLLAYNIANIYEKREAINE